MEGIVLVFVTFFNKATGNWNWQSLPQLAGVRWFVVIVMGGGDQDKGGFTRWLESNIIYYKQLMTHKLAVAGATLFCVLLLTPPGHALLSHPGSATSHQQPPLQQM